MQKSLLNNLGLNPNRPWMTPTEISIIEEILTTLQQDVKVFEYGCGYSSIYFSRLLKRFNKDYVWHSVESNREWYLKIKQLSHKHALDNTHLHLVDFKGLRPGKDEFPGKVRDEYVRKFRQLGGDFNLVIVDGRFRRRCLDFVMEHASNCLALLHDAEREKYHCSDYDGESLIIDTGVYPYLQNRKLKRLFVAASCADKLAGFQCDVVEKLDIFGMNADSERLYQSYNNKLYAYMRKLILYGTKIVEQPHRSFNNAGHKIQRLIGWAH